MVLGREVCFTENGVTKYGIAVDINNDGGLIVKTADGLATLSTGEITLRVK